MALFNEKIILKHIDVPQALPSTHQEVISNWINHIHSGTLANLNEVEVHASFTNQIMCKLLGYTAVGESESYTVGKLELDAKRLTCTWSGEPVDLTLTEFWMVYSLVRRAGHVKSRDQLMQESHLVVDENTVTSHIKRVRRKFQELDPAFDAIDTVYGMGYRWQVG